MKRIALCLGLLFMSSCACAEIMDFRYFSLDIPEGWTASEEGPVVMVKSDDDSGALTITADDPRGNSVGDLATAFSLELGGTMPERDEDGIYSFTFNGGDGHATITGDEEFYMLIVGTGIEKNSETLTRILDSLEMK